MFKPTNGKGTDMGTNKPEIDAEQAFPLLILYSSPPEAASLSNWIRDVEDKHNRNRSARETQPNSGPGNSPNETE